MPPASLVRSRVNLQLSDVPISVHSTPDKIQNDVFTLKTHQMFSVNTTPTLPRRNLKKHQSLLIWICVSGKERKSRDDRDVIVFEKLRCQNVVQTKTQSLFRFRDRLVWMLGLT